MKIDQSNNITVPQRRCVMKEDTGTLTVLPNYMRFSFG